MKGIGILSVMAGVAMFVLPLLKVNLPFLYLMGDLRPIAAVIFILIGIGIFMFSGTD